MAPSSPRPLWGWTKAVRLWTSLSGALAALGLIATGSGPHDRPAAPAPRLVVDPDTAPPVVLAALPHLGPAMVGRIVAEREKAPFRSLEDLEGRVRGIGPATAASLRPFLQIEVPGTLAATSSAGTARPIAAATMTAPLRLARTP